MPTRKSLSSVLQGPPAALPPSRLPSPLKFPLLVILSFTSSSLLHSLAAAYTAGEVGQVSRRLNNWPEVLALIAWRTAELGIAWTSGFDGIDLASLTFLSHLPAAYFLISFYSIHPATGLLSVAIDVFSSYIPFRLLRPLIAVHDPDATESAVPNRSIINDITTRIAVTSLGAAVYGVVLYASFTSWLPVSLVTHFSGLRDISTAHSATFPWLMAAMLPVGVAAKAFIFSPSVASSDQRAIAPFDPVTATLSETVRYNTWGYSPRVKVLFARTAVLVVFTSLHTWLQTFITIEGADGLGALSYAAVWAVAGSITGIVFGWVGDA